MEWIAAVVTAAAAGVAGIITALYKRNENKKDQYEHEEKLIEIASGTNEIKEKVIELSRTTAETDKMLLRNSILSIYFEYQKEKALPEEQFASILGMYDVYVSIGGNGYITEKIDEVKKWRRY